MVLQYNVKFDKFNKINMVLVFLFLVPPRLLFVSLLSSFALSPIREKRMNKKERFQMNPYKCNVLYLVCFFGSINYNYNKSYSSIIIYEQLLVLFFCYSLLVIQFINITRGFDTKFIRFPIELFVVSFSHCFFLKTKTINKHIKYM